MTPIERLIHHEQLIDMILEHQYVPHKSQANWGDVVVALQELTGQTYCLDCSGSLLDIATQAKGFVKRHRETEPPKITEEWIASLPVYEADSCKEIEETIQAERKEFENGGTKRELIDPPIANSLSKYKPMTEEQKAKRRKPKL